MRTLSRQLEIPRAHKQQIQSLFLPFVFLTRRIHVLQQRNLRPDRHIAALRIDSLQVPYNLQQLGLASPHDVYLWPIGMLRVLGQSVQGDAARGADEEGDLTRAGGPKGRVGFLHRLEIHHSWLAGRLVVDMVIVEVR